ncbi:MAG: hypothetical protein A2V67_02120 [Deltaproteobacteria bacterium RBG_13_61_14]|nr:MAG: hypothetical protein A2V67_02120 [Deltaproteobacteria bacterium RBG_13_61_14]
MQVDRLSVWLLAAALSFGLASSCSKETPQPAPAAPAQAKAKTKADEPAGKGEAAEGAVLEPSKATVWSYNPTGKRDIFEIPKPREDECQKNPLTCYDLRQLWVDAILFGSGMDVAHVIMPNGKDAMLRVGDEVGLNHGRVKQIREKEIVIEEIYVDPATRDIHIIEKTMRMK